MNQPDQSSRKGEALPPAVVEAVCEGVILSVRDGTVVVEVADPAECEACLGKGQCQLAPGGGRRVELPGTGFKTGDRVRISASSPAILRASLVLYLVPALLVVCGAFAGYAVGSAYLRVSGDLASTGGVVLGILLSLAFVHYYRAGRDGERPIVHLTKIE